MLQCVIYIIYALWFIVAASEWVGRGNISLGGRELLNHSAGLMIQPLGDLLKVFCALVSTYKKSIPYA